MRWLAVSVLLVGLALVAWALFRSGPPVPRNLPAATEEAPGEAPGNASGPSAAETPPRRGLVLSDWTPSSARTPLKVLEKRWFRIGYDESRKNPAWVSYAVSGPIAFPGREPTRPATFQTDFSTSAHVSHRDYSKSGYDRGHMCPAYAMWCRFGAEAFVATFVCSNVVPQPHAVNAGIWEDLESEISGRSGRSGGWAERSPLLVMNGPVYGDRPDRFPSGVTVPALCFSVVLREGAGGLECLAFEIPNEGRPGGPLSRYLVSVGRIEKDTGLDFFAQGHERDRARLENAAPDRLWP